MTRRTLLQTLLAPALPLLPWSPGLLDIHHIQTGRGNATLLQLPDSTTLLLDAGHAASPLPYLNPAFPNASLSPGERIARYILAQNITRLDFAIATHNHDDHAAALPTVARLLPIRTLLTRDSPIPHLPYLQTLAANGQVWTGTANTFLPAPPNLPENALSLAFRLTYGPFRYYTGADLTTDTLEIPAARVCGPVDVATVNHHGYYDAAGTEFVRALRPRIWILQAWHASHPAMNVLANLYDPALYPGPRDVYSTGLHPAAALTTARFSARFKSTSGHIVIRVARGGLAYTVNGEPFALNSSTHP